MSPLPAYAHYAPNILVSCLRPQTAHVEINRPDKLNAFTEPVWRALGAAFIQISHDAEIRAVVLSGAGDRAFTAGLDVAAAGDEFAAVLGQSDDVARRAKGLRLHIYDFQEAISSIEKCEKPVICVMHGIALGLAIDIATAADIRFCASETRFAVKEVDIGLAADIGTLARLPRIVGSMSWVRDVCLTARDFDAAEALAVGFVSKVYETKAEAVEAGLELARVLAEKSPVAVQGTKEILKHAQDHGVAENLRYTAVWNSAMMQSEDFKTAMMSGLMRRKPTFEKL